MKKPNILIIGATGKLGTMLLNYCSKSNILVNTITCFSNKKKIKTYAKKYKTKNDYVLSNEFDKKEFLKLICHTNFNIVYFLDYGSKSLELLHTYLQNQSNSYIAIANKELIIAGGKLLFSKIKSTNNIFIPLDSEHFSLINNSLQNDIEKIYITASGGPFYFNKKLNLNLVSKKQVLSHPKWKMGYNNLIDSSNFINKILEIIELSIIYNLDINKIDFLVSPEAYMHSIVLFKNNTISINCFDNNMLITLLYPLSFFYKLLPLRKHNQIMNINSFYLEKFKDKRFKIMKYYSNIKHFNHYNQIQFMLLNNIAQKLYLANKLRYNKIPDFIFKNIDFNNNNISLNSINSILNAIKKSKSNYEKLFKIS